ncbi:surface antigen TASV, putative,mucin-like glycoprotein, putative [Trypanosoma cruzi marinkellei]|uniref:Surface antigen TASV, putative,mucin-like glycoprotein, putative n=1 Tax=Trypanosoma cruzi marinkellei TaxID=85056 RepID=K2NK03_TRYCR|nr:surface antigen TASV, putative,mucin-like glycoprotein, putative [Trypanosoma cruzi marinkellei]
MYSSPTSSCCFSLTVQIVSHTRATLRRMMLMVTVRRRVACDLLVLALLCCCCCLSVSGAATPNVGFSAPPVKTYVDVLVSCPGKDGKLRWRLVTEEDYELYWPFYTEEGWNKCPKKLGEVDQDNDERARLCVVAGDMFERDRINKALCRPPGKWVEFSFQMTFATYGNLTGSSVAATENNDRAAAGGSQQPQSQPLDSAARAAAPAAASVGQAQSGGVSSQEKAADAPQRMFEHTAEDGSHPRQSENNVASPLTSTDAAVQGGQRDGERVVDEGVQGKGELPGTSQDATPLGGEADKHVASAPEASSRPSSSPSGAGAANEASHNNNEGNTQPHANGEGSGTVTGTNAPQPTTDGSTNESAEDIAALLGSFGSPDGSDATTVWVRTPLLLLVTALVCAALQ